ncbi:MAG TPA: glycosyltransferase [Pirellulales bacterium]|nr:glycosyltransferase [Pirellulales bacterium]
MVSSFASGDAADTKLGGYGYSYDFVRRAFQPLLERWAEVVTVGLPESRLDFAIRRARQGGREAIALSFRPLSDVYLTRWAPNVVFPFWEFPDVPGCDYKQNPRRNGVRIANHASLILTAGEFTAAALARADVRTPVRVVPVPIDDGYFRVPAWEPAAVTVLDCDAYVFTRPEVPPLEATHHEFRPGVDTPAFRLKTRLKAMLRRAWIAGVKPLLPPRLAKALVMAKNAGLRAWREGETQLPEPVKRLELSGVVYTTIFNPDDLRKNWRDLLTAFLLALADRDDATLVVKLVTSHAPPVRDVLAYYHQLGLSHRCRVVFVNDYLSDQAMRDLARASAFYLNASRAEGACLPLQDFLAAGRPAIAPSHTAMADYFDDRLGFVVDSHPEPCPWPADESGRLNTSWHRIVWSSLRDQIAKSYAVATFDRAGYQALAAAARRKMTEWASAEAVWPRLAAALSALGKATEPSDG